MTKFKLIYKIIPVFLIVSIFFTACDVPDISEFTTASAEMTKAVRLGIKETGGVLDAVSKSNLIEDPSKEVILNENARYAKNMKPTMKALNSLDAYLEALNALALANKKSDENAAALVDSVSSLASAVSGVQIPETALKVGTIIVSLVNQFKTAKDFKKRVTLVELIVNGATADPDQPCTVENAKAITKIVRNAIDAMDSAVRAQRIIEEQNLGLPAGTDIDTALANFIALKTENPTAAADKTRLDNLRGGLIKIQKIYDRKINSLDEKQREALHKSFETNFCGVIDIIKLNMQDLDNVQKAGLMLLFSNAKKSNQSLLEYHDAIKSNDLRVQKTIGAILFYKNQRERLKELKSLRRNRLTPASRLPAIDEEIAGLNSRIPGTLETMSVYDDGIELIIAAPIQIVNLACNADVNCNNNSQERNKRITALILPAALNPLLEKREAELLKENSRLLAELERVDAQYKVANAELNAIKDKQKQMNLLFETMLTGLDIWGETHSNLRLTLNTKTKISGARLKSIAEEILKILKPEETSAD